MQINIQFREIKFLATGEFESFDSSDHDRCLWPERYEFALASPRFVCVRPCVRCEDLVFEDSRSRFHDNDNLHIPQMIIDRDFNTFWVSTLNLPTVIKVFLPFRRMVSFRLRIFIQSCWNDIIFYLGHDDRICNRRTSW